MRNFHLSRLRSTSPQYQEADSDFDRGKHPTLLVLARIHLRRISRRRHYPLTIPRFGFVDLLALDRQCSTQVQKQGPSRPRKEGEHY